MFDQKWEDNLIRNIRNNIVWLLKNKYEDSQTIMAKSLDIRTNTLNTYINKDTKPSVTFICKVCQQNNISIDDFMHGDLKLTEKTIRRREVARKKYTKYEGLYYTYFLVVDSNSLKEGLIQESLLQIKEDGQLSFEILNTNKKFIGNLSMSDELLFFDMRNNNEKVNITLKNPGSTIREKFISGIGIINISSPEDNRIPSAQKIIISRARIPIDKYFNTLIDFLSLDIYIKIKKKFFNELLLNELEISDDKYNQIKNLVDDDKISEEDRLIINRKQMMMIQQILDKEELYYLCNKAIELNLSNEVIWSNSIKASLDENKMVYKFIKNEFKDRNF